LKLIVDRDSERAAVSKRFFLRPTWDARQTVRTAPSGAYTLVKHPPGRRPVASLMSLDEIESLLAGWSEPMPNAPARLPWQAGVVEQYSDALRTTTKVQASHSKASPA
jgi:hypothetical protein